MNKIPVEIGRVVISKCGRDEGRIFLVTGEIDEDFVLISDGDTHKIAKQKKKRRKHLKPTLSASAELRERILTGNMPEDYEIRSCLSKEDKTCRSLI